MKGNTFSNSHRESILKDKELFLQGIHCTIPYWEIKPAQFEAKLRELLMHDIKSIALFVPWAHFETDIHHCLYKFLKHCAHLHIKVKLIVLPELGINYPNAGIPKKLFSNHSNSSVDQSGHLICSKTAPNIFPLPSLSSPEVLKEIGNYLLKLTGLLQDFSKDRSLDGNFEILVSSSFYNYYRNPTLGSDSHGDFSVSQVLAFKDFIEKEFPSNAAEQIADAEKFRSAVYEPMNRHRFLTFAENLLKEKTKMIFARKLSSVKIRDIDLVHPESLPETSDLHLMTEILRFKPAVSLFVENIKQAAAHGQSVFFSSEGVYRNLLNAEKKYLAELALSLCGEVFMSVDDYLSVQPNANLIPAEMEKETQVSYLSASKFCSEDAISSRLQRRAQGHYQLVALSEFVPQMSEKLVFIDPKMIFRAVEWIKCLSFAQLGKVVAVPAPIRLENGSCLNYAVDALSFYDRWMRSQNSLKITTGFFCEVMDHGLGQVVFYDAAAFWNKQESTVVSEEALTLFLNSMLGLAEVQLTCQASDPAVIVQTHVHRDDQSLRGVSVSNPSKTPVRTMLNLRAPAFLQDSRTQVRIYANEKQAEIELPALSTLTFALEEASQSDFNMQSMNEGGFHGIET